MITAAEVRGRFQVQLHLREKLATSARQAPPTLYHYTDATGLLGIITSGTVWATHYAYLNDASEFKYAVDLMKDVVTKATVGADSDSWKGRFRQVIAQDDDSPLFGYDQVQDTEEQYFVACFSEVGDGLSQWRGYGKSIGGYSLGFEFSDLLSIRKRINDSQTGKEVSRANPGIKAKFLPCWYKRKEQMALIAEGFGIVLRHCETTEYSGDDSLLKTMLSAIVEAVSSSFKDPAFEDEREWRLVLRLYSPRLDSVLLGKKRDRTDDDKRIDQVAAVHFRKGEYSLVPYVVVPVASNGPVSLSQVVVGPTPLPENARAALMQLLLPGGEGPPPRRVVCTHVTNSIIPFRRV
jgi:hypothetical protein